MTPVVAVRPGDANDRDFVLDLGRRVSATSISALRPVPALFVQTAFDRLISYLFTRQHHILIAHDGDRRCGFLLLVTDMPDEVTLSDQGFVAYMAVEPTLQRRGFGAALLAAAEETARAYGLRFLSLMVTEDNAPAQALYRRFGLRTERRMLTKALD